MKTMRILKYVMSLSFLALTILRCANDDDKTGFVNQIPAPTNLEMSVRVTQDNSGLVTLTPSGEGVSYYIIDFGDNSEKSEDIQPGERVNHTYEEGSYQVVLTAYNLAGKTTEITQPIEVSFQAPQNLEVVIENDVALSKTVNVTASADFAMFYEVSFGEDASAEPLSANIGETISFTYQDAGVYTISVEVFGAAIETTTYTEDFEVVAILQPLESAPTPPGRDENDVISIFSAAYANEPGANYFPDWGQGGCCGSGWAMFDLAGDEMLQYTNLSYQGNEFGAAVDVSDMEYIHLDVWTADVLQTIEVSLISASNGERPVVAALTPNAWTSIDIPISDYTSQSGFTVADIFQLKYVGTPSGEGTVFIDNIYFYRGASAPTSPTEAAPDPTHPEANVVSIYSDSYTNVTVNEWNPGWGQTTILTSEIIDGNNTLLYEALNYTGIVTDYDNPTDLSAMTFAHFDYWSPDATSLGLKLVNTSYADNDPLKEDIEFVATVTNGEWVSVEIALSDYTTDVSGVTQLLFESSGGTVYIDNLYFHN